MKTDQSLVQERRQDRIERLHRPGAVAVSPSLTYTNTRICWVGWWGKGGAVKEEVEIFTSLKSQPFSHIGVGIGRRSNLISIVTQSSDSWRCRTKAEGFTGAPRKADCKERN